MTIKIATTHENEVRDGYETVKSRLAEAEERLATAQEAETIAQSKVDRHRALAATTEEMPENYAHDLAELQASLTWATARAGNLRAEVAEAQRQYDDAAKSLAWARMRDRAEAIAAFDRDEFTARFAALVAPIAAEAWDELNTLADLEGEISQIATEAGIGNDHPGYSVPNMGVGTHSVEGTNLQPAGLSSSLIADALKAPENPRIVEARERARAETAAKREAERDEAARLRAEEERLAPIREARARYEKDLAKWETFISRGYSPRETGPRPEPSQYGLVAG